MGTRRTEVEHFAICVDPSPSSDLALLRVYRVVGEGEAGFIRVIDESGEDYLYPQDAFVQVELSEESATRVSLAARLGG